MDRPNILFVFTDQQHFGMMGCAGNASVSTPAMDSLAAEGVRFDRAYCTNPVCCPSRFSLLTGRMPSEVGMLSNFVLRPTDISESIRTGTIGNRMRAARYASAYGGKWHVPTTSIEEAGFDYITDNERDGLADTCVQYIEGKHNQPFCLVASFINPHDICHMALHDSIPELARFDERMRRLAERRLPAMDAALAHPLGVDDETFFDRYCPPLPANFEPQADEPEAISIMLEARRFRRYARRHWTDRRWREHRWAYARLTEQVDGQIGRVLGALRNSQHADNTLIVFTSDHGDMDGAHRLEQKSVLYDPACRIPLIVRPPGRARTGRVDHTHLISNGLDLLPTFCDYAGVAPPPGLAGRSLRPLVEIGQTDGWRKAVPIEAVAGRAIVTDAFKYARYDFGHNAEQLYDLVDDPLEQRNALHDSRHAGAVTQLRLEYDRMFTNSPRPPALEIIKSLDFA